MTSLGTGKTGKPGKFTGLGTVVLAIVFLVAMVFAANNSTVLGWVIAVIAFGWLVLSTLVYIGVHRAAAFGARQVKLVQAEMAQRNSAGGPAGGGTTLVSDDGGTRQAAKARELKLDHSFKIISVQVGVVNEYQGKDQGMVERALETIDITARNGRGMINPNWEAQEAKMDAAMARKDADRAAQPKPSATEPDDGEAVSGVVLD
ncbi:hypothetical protein QO003_003443 [Arthrobacter silviterrae]|uniref:Uncharacterized protein n=1 Tax=Arthrobacter silviterrae TaxID=2026658 RepID=A0ABX0D8P2_9MICC|nr:MULTISPECIES: hypothetical protein [Arthrobacter]MCU6481725.1 hypothetical protein [Arthrobacter sp. A2-55]MDQ0279140.1 hypothetical protein [Arthrobacter silviterrae]NGN83261.1 hypothetical protein [Arthrobacter silviterrae]